jgi:hypothetical protein
MLSHCFEYQQENSRCEPLKEIFSFGNPRSCIGLNHVNIADVPAHEFVSLVKNWYAANVVWESALPWYKIQLSSYKFCPSC